MLESYLLVATLVLVNGDTLEAVGEEYPTYEECVRENKKEMENIKNEIENNPVVFKNMTFECQHLKVEFEGVSLNVE